MARRMAFGAQDASGIIDLDHLIILINATTTGINRKRVLIDDLLGPISDLRRLVSWRHELRRKVSEGSRGGLNLAIISLAASPRKDRSHSGCSRQTL